MNSSASWLWLGIWEVHVVTGGITVAVVPIRGCGAAKWSCTAGLHDRLSLMDWTRRMVLFGRVVVALGVVAALVSLVLVERLSSTYEDGLAVTNDSAVLVADAVEPVSTLASELGQLASELAAGIDVTRELLGLSEEVLAEVGAAASTNLAEMAAGAAGISERLAGLVEAIERLIPGDSESLAEDLRAFADGLEPLSEQLTVLGDRLTAAADELAAADPALEALAGRIDAVVVSIDALGPSLDSLDATARDVRDRADEAANRLGLDRWLLRLLIVALGSVIVIVGVVIERFATRVAGLEPAGSPVEIAEPSNGPSSVS